MTSLAVAYMMDRVFSLVTLLVEESERGVIGVLMGILLWSGVACCHPLEVQMGPELPLHCLLCLRAGQGSASTIYFLHGMYPSEEGSCGGPWGVDFCSVILPAYMWDKASLYVP